MTAIAALSEVKISNMALGRLGVSIGIQSFNDQSVQAQQCAFWYPICRDQLLRSAPWNFAYTSAILTSDTTFFPGYACAYQYPQDCLQAIGVTTKYGLRFRSYYWAAYWGYPFAAGSPYSGGKIPFKVVQSQNIPGQRAIVTDLGSTAADPAYLLYIGGVTDVAMFDVLFTNALSALLAGSIGGMLKADAQKIQATKQEAEMLRLQALAQCMNEAQQDPAPQSPSVAVRWG